MDPLILSEALTSGGVVGVLGIGVALLWIKLGKREDEYRADRQKSEERWAGIAEESNKIRSDQVVETASLKSVIEVNNENTKELKNLLSSDLYKKVINDNGSNNTNN